MVPQVLGQLAGQGGLDAHLMQATGQNATGSFEHHCGVPSG
jgi:hypothetical protein